MSYILDAISKSERERTEQQAAPLSQAVEIKDTLMLSDRWVASWWVAAGLLGLFITVVGVFWPTESQLKPSVIDVAQPQRHQSYQPTQTNKLKTQALKTSAPKTTQSLKTQSLNTMQIKQIYQGSASPQSVINRQKILTAAKNPPASVAIASLYDEPRYDKPKLAEPERSGSASALQVRPAQAGVPVLTASELNAIRSDFDINEARRQALEEENRSVTNNFPAVDAQTEALLAAPIKGLRSKSYDVRANTKPVASKHLAAPMFDARGEKSPAVVNDVVLTKEVLTNEVLTNEVPMVDDLPLSLRRMIPDIDFSAHVYSGNKSGGFVILNGSMRSPGDRVAQDLYVDKILESAVVMRLGKSRFKLKSMTSWYTPALD